MEIDPGAPVVTNLVAHAVMVCPCVGKILLLSIFGGVVQCPSCMKFWMSPELSYNMGSLDPNQGQVKCIIREHKPSPVATGAQAELENALRAASDRKKLIGS